MMLDLQVGRPSRLQRRGWVPGVPVHDQPPAEQDPGDPPSWEEGAMRWTPQLALSFEPLDRRRSLIAL